MKTYKIIGWILVSALTIWFIKNLIFNALSYKYLSHPHAGTVIQF